MTTGFAEHRPALVSSFALIFTLLAALLSACASQPPESVAPMQSANDEKSYRLVTLDNGLKALLISDPETQKAAASLDVHVGSGDNPRGRGGLAHFLEHMLFLGTEKYPDAAEYERYITEHGGSRNAYTSLEHTNYFFDVDAPHFEGALDRFAQFFIAPNFNADLVERERNAVQAEYQMGLKSDGRRGLDVLQATMNPDHPFSEFAVGSLETLADREDSSIRDELISFYRKHYSADVMRLAVLGSESLDEIETMVRGIFAPVPNRNVGLEPIEEPLFVEAQLPMLLTVQPTGTQQQLQVNFPIADYRAAYDAKPMSYIGGLVGHEGQGSLLSALKREGLADGLSAGVGLAWRGGALFSVTASLTDAGVQDYQRVLQLLFAYLKMLREEGPQERLYAEQSAVSDLAFRFQEPRSPSGTVTSLSNAMHYYADEDLLRGPFLMQRYDADLLEDALSALTADRAQVTLTAPGVSTNSVSPYYGVPYSQRGPEAIMLGRWREPVADAELQLPAPNPFIAEDLTLAPIAEDNPATPEVRLLAPRKRIWFRQAEDFRVPKGAMYMSFRSPLVSQDARQIAQASIYTRMVTDSLNEFTYPARLAGLGFDFYRHAQGITLRISGYDDRQVALLQRLLDKIGAQQFDGMRFERIRRDMIRALNNTVAQRPSSQLINDLRRALLDVEFGEEDIAAELETLDLQALESYRERFWNTARAEVLLYGNHEPATIDAVSAALERILPSGQGEPALAPDVLALDAGDSLLLASDIDHNDSVVAWYLQGEGLTLNDRAAMSLTAQIVQSGFFQQLRTEQQLGYVVSSFAWHQYDVPGLMLLVQSPSHDAQTVYAAMEEFLHGTLEDIDLAQFERHRAALVNEILEPDKNLGERAEFYWQAIAFRQWGFDRPQRLAEAVGSIDYDQWRAFFERAILEQPRSLLAASAGARDVLPRPEEAVTYTAPEVLRESEPRVEIGLEPL